MVCQVAQLGRANEGEVRRIEDEYGPLAGNVFVANLEKLTIFERVSFESGNGLVDECHTGLPRLLPIGGTAFSKALPGM